MGAAASIGRGLSVSEDSPAGSVVTPLASPGGFDVVTVADPLADAVELIEASDAELVEPVLLLVAEADAESDPSSESGEKAGLSAVHPEVAPSNPASAIGAASLETSLTV